MAAAAAVIKDVAVTREVTIPIEEERQVRVLFIWCYERRPQGLTLRHRTVAGPMTRAFCGHTQGDLPEAQNDDRASAGLGGRSKNPFAFGSI